MQHPDGDDLALFALGESLGSAVADHVAGCAECASEVESFRTTVGLAGLSNFGEIAPQPGEHVWQAIATELGFEEASGDVLTEIDDRRPVAGRDVPPTLRSVPGTGTELPPAVVAGSNGPTTDDSTVPGDTTGPKRWSRWVAPLAAVVIGIAVGAGAVIIAQNRGDSVTVEAVAPLTPVKNALPDKDPTQQLGTAELVAAPTGQQVRVDAADLPPTSNDYEVWLFGDDGKMVSLGTLNDGSGTFTVPQGISTQEYRTIDVSDEKPDGNPLHSGISLIRGSFS